MIIDSSINHFIDQSLIDANKKREEKHEPSGKLSASMLYQPLRFQVLKTIGAPRKEFDPYTLAKFERGNQVEEWFVKKLSDAGFIVDDEQELKDYLLEPSDEQPKAVYKDVVGYVDSVIDTDLMYSKRGVIPNEIKSVTNAKLKRIDKTGVDWHYRVQACFYALAMNVDHYGVTIVSSEDLRSSTYMFKTKADGFVNRIHKIIDEYDKAIDEWFTKHKLPAFSPKPEVSWTKNIAYAMYDEFYITRSDQDVIKKLEELGLA